MAWMNEVNIPAIERLFRLIDNNNNIENVSRHVGKNFKTKLVKGTTVAKKEISLISDCDSMTDLYSSGNSAVVLKSFDNM